jgi:3-hydroxybutyryl-CoA dehydrogenase
MALVRTVAVIGAGLKGRSIAQTAALAGYHTILEDILPAALRKAEDEFRNGLNQAIGSGKVPANDAAAALSRLEYAESLEEAARKADFVIEAVPDELESKLEIFIMLDKICRPGTILVCSSSSLSVTEIASVTYRPKQCVGMRLPKSFQVGNLLEIIRGRETDDDTLATAVEVGKRMGKEVVIVSAQS